MKKRSFLSLLGTVALGGLAFWKRDPLLETALQTLINNEDLSISDNDIASCKLHPIQEEGPYYLNSPFRSNIKEDRKGAHFDLDIQVVTENNCSPLEDAIVEIWHCDAEGNYSAYPSDISRSMTRTLALFDLSDIAAHVPSTGNTTFLRGAQRTSADGKATFQTIIPGWYTPRAPHIHIKVQLPNEGQFTSQLYFPAQLTNRLYTQHPDYKAYGPARFNHQNDILIRQAKSAEGLVIPITENAGKFRSTIRLVV